MFRLDLARGMRLHFLMFAARSGVPFLPLPYAGKVFDFTQATDAPSLRGSFMRRRDCYSPRSTGCGTNTSSVCCGSANGYASCRRHA